MRKLKVKTVKESPNLKKVYSNQPTMWWKWKFQMVNEILQFVNMKLRMEVWESWFPINRRIKEYFFFFA